MPGYIKIIPATKWIVCVHVCMCACARVRVCACACACVCETIIFESAFTGHNYSPICDVAVKINLFPDIFSKVIATKLQKLEL